MVDVQHIWNPETGICDLSEDECRALTKVSHIRDEWGCIYDLLRTADQVESFFLQRNRKAAIETGQIEGLYDLPRGTTNSLIKEGFDSAVLAHAVPDHERIRNLLKDQNSIIEGVFDLVSNRTPLTLSLIKQLHQAITQHQGDIEVVDSQGNVQKTPLLRGDWKKYPNNVRRGDLQFEYCPPIQVQQQMEQLLDYHNKHEEESVSGEISAAWLHHRFTQIHPFQDGNGRMARILASIVLLKNRLYPLVVLRDQKVQYIEALEQADAGDLAPLTDYFSNVQFAEHEASLSALPGTAVGITAALALAEVRKERLANAPAFRLHDLLSLVDITVVEETNRIHEQMQGALSSKELTARGLGIEVTLGFPKRLIQCLPEESDLAYSYTDDIEDTLVAVVSANQIARNLTLTLDIHFRFDAFHRQVIGRADWRLEHPYHHSESALGGEVVIPPYEIDKEEQSKEVRKQLQDWSARLTTEFILKALEVFFPR